MGVNTGIGLPGTTTTTTDFSGLSENQVPVFRNNQLEDSGFQINAITRALQGATNIETLADIQSGVSTFRLGQAHTMTSAGENVTFRNTVNDVVFHPSWQTTEPAGEWASVQRTPVGELVEDFIFQADRSETVTNPDFLFTSLPFNNRLYEVQIEPVADVENVIVVIQRNNGTEFVDYWRSRLINLTTSQLASPAPQNIAINPFIDLIASTEYRLIARAATDITLRGNAAGVPRILLTYRQWIDNPLATREYVNNSPTVGATTFTALSDTPGAYEENRYLISTASGLEFINPFVIDGTIDITADVTITSANASDYNRRLWQITGGDRTVTIAEGAGLTFFGVYVRRQGDTGTINVTGADSRINGTTTTPFQGMQSSSFFAIRENRYNELTNNFRPVNFESLGNTPDTLGTAGQIPAVNTDGDALEFITAPTGAQGPQGPQGETGPAGAAGNDGTNGQAGETGPAGETGETGGTGPAGETGQAGMDGAAGATTFAALTDTPTGLGTSGQIPAVNAAGDGLEFIASTAGAQGPQGDRGPAGETGNDGNDGATGGAGPAGETGANGNDGANGQPGTQGPAGNNGNDGTNGAQGETGPAGNDGAAGVIGPSGETGPDGMDGAAGATTFTALSDTPAGLGSAGQIPAVNAAGDALEFIAAPTSSTGDARWDAQPLPATMLPNSHRRFYVYAAEPSVSVQLPTQPATNLFNGWSVFISNDSLIGTITITGNFRGSITTVRLLPQQGCEIVFFLGGPYYVEGPARENITVEQFPPFRTVLTQNANYTEPSTGLTWSSSVGGINLQNRQTILDLRGKLAQVTGHTGTFIFDLPSIPNADLPVGMGFAFGNIGAANINIRTRNNDQITGLGINYDFSRPLILPVNSIVTVIVQSDDVWNITQIVGAIGGGF